MKKLFPIVLIVMGAGAGTGAGLILQPLSEKSVEDSVSEQHGAEIAAPASGDHALKEYVKIANQFVVPIVEEKRVTALVVLSLSLEVMQGQTDSVFVLEPKLRDGFLQLLFEHANSGGFEGSFTETERLAVIRRGLLDVARRVLGPGVSDVLITDIMRQDS